ncbi:hypothetical protein NIES2101_20845 [Calothrix sp. HK-06]|nr:hypothetical protein NIES2101_20845 [Calothrix sp. HK-06]
MKKILEESNEHRLGVTPKGATPSLASQWAKKYLQNLYNGLYQQSEPERESLNNVVSQDGRKKTAQSLYSSLWTVSHQAWNRVEILLATEAKRHKIDPELINPWEITAESFKIYEKTLKVYTQQAPLRQLFTVMRLARTGEPLSEKVLSIYTKQVAPSQLATVIGYSVGEIRKKYTKQNPRVIGFVRMQFHYTSQMLLDTLSPLKRSIISAYFKVIHDHLYMPLQREEIRQRLTTQQVDTLMPYYQVLWQMFSPEVFGEHDFRKGSDEFDEDFVNSLFA